MPTDTTKSKSFFPLYKNNKDSDRKMQYDTQDDSTGTAQKLAHLRSIGKGSHVTKLTSKKK